MSSKFRLHCAAVIGPLLLLSVPATDAQTWRHLSFTASSETSAHLFPASTEALSGAPSALTSWPDRPPSNLAETRTTVGFANLEQRSLNARPLTIDQDGGVVSLSAVYATRWRATLACKVHPVSCGQDPLRLLWVAVSTWHSGPVQVLPVIKLSERSMLNSWNAVAARGAGFDGFGNRLLQYAYGPLLSATHADLHAPIRATLPTGYFFSDPYTQGP